MEGVLTGSARVAQEARDNTEITRHGQAIQQQRINLERKRKKMEAQMAALKSEFEAEEAETLKLIGIEEEQLFMNAAGQKKMALSRRAKTGGKTNES
jgi:circadian clock protein KaiC